MYTNRRGFTLIELLVVVAIIALLLSILLPGLSHARRAAQRVTCQSNMKQAGTVLRAYAVEHNGIFPVVHGCDIDFPQPVTNEWWELAEGNGLREELLRCPVDKQGEALGLRSYILNCIISFCKQEVDIPDPARKIIVSERNHDGDFTLQNCTEGYHAWQPVPQWKDLIKPDRHLNMGNYLFGDGHVALLKQEETLGPTETRTEANKHFITDLAPGYAD